MSLYQINRAATTIAAYVMFQSVRFNFPLVLVLDKLLSEQERKDSGHGRRFFCRFRYARAEAERNLERERYAF